MAAIDCIECLADGYRHSGCWKSPVDALAALARALESVPSLVGVTLSAATVLHPQIALVAGDMLETVNPRVLHSPGNIDSGSDRNDNVLTVYGPALSLGNPPSAAQCAGVSVALCHASLRLRQLQHESLRTRRTENRQMLFIEGLPEDSSITCCNLMLAEPEPTNGILRRRGD